MTAGASPRIVTFNGRRLVKLGNARINFRKACALIAITRPAFIAFAPREITLDCGGRLTPWRLTSRLRSDILSAWDAIMDFADEEAAEADRAIRNRAKERVTHL